MSSLRRVGPVLVACAIVAVGAAVALSDGRDRTPTEPAPATIDAGSVLPASTPQIRRIDGVANVTSGIHALGSVWAVTSNLPDVWSQGAVEAAVARIEPATGSVEIVLEVPGAEPVLSALGGRMWVNLPDRMVALDASGAQVASVPFAPIAPGDHVAGERHLWVLDRDGGRVVVVDPATATIVRTIETGSFPVRPISAFGRIWIPSIIDGTVTIIDEATLGEAELMRPFVSSAWLTDVTAVPNARTGDEVWVTDVDGDVFAIAAEGRGFGGVRRIDLETAVNRIHVDGQRAFLLPVSGIDVLVLDLETERLEARIRTDAIPFRALLADDLLWVAEDGVTEILTVIDARSLAIRRTFDIGSNVSLTTGPQQPLRVGDEIWIPNRGDDAIFVVPIDAA